MEKSEIFERSVKNTSKRAYITAKELIQILETVPEDLPIIDSSFMPLEGHVKVIDEYPEGDPANPLCTYIKAVLLE